MDDASAHQWAATHQSRHREAAGCDLRAGRDRCFNRECYPPDEAEEEAKPKAKGFRDLPEEYRASLEARLLGAVRGRAIACVTAEDCRWLLESAFDTLAELLNSHWFCCDELDLGDINSLATCPGRSVWVDYLAADLIAAVANIPVMGRLMGRLKAGETQGCFDLALIGKCQNLSRLQEIITDFTSIDDVAAAIMGAAARPGLILSNNNRITSTGWQYFFRALDSVYKLDITRLDDSNVNGDDEVMFEVADCLSRCNYFDLQAIGIKRASIERALCNTRSIDHTYRSNHTLVSIGNINTKLPRSLEILLRKNMLRDKSVVARRKILDNHFRTGFSMEPFDETVMPTQLLPGVLAWIGKSSGKRTRSAMFDFLRRKPSLFEAPSPPAGGRDGDA